MKRFALYDAATGRIKQITLASHLEAVVDSMAPGENALEVEGDVSDGSHYMSEGGPQPMPARPGAWAEFDWNEKTWRDPRGLEELRAARWQSIKAAREEAISAPLTTPHGIFDADAKSRANITDAILMLQTLQGMGEATTVDFTLADDTTVTLTTEQLVAVGLILGQRTQTAFSAARALREQIDAAATAEDINGVSWPPIPP